MKGGGETFLKKSFPSPLPNFPPPLPKTFPLTQSLIQSVPYDRETRLAERFSSSASRAFGTRPGSWPPLLQKGFPRLVFLLEKHVDCRCGDAHFTAFRVCARCRHCMAARRFGGGGRAHGGTADSVHGTAAVRRRYAVPLPDRRLHAGTAAGRFRLRACVGGNAPSWPYGRGSWLWRAWRERESSCGLSRRVWRSARKCLERPLRCSVSVLRISGAS